MAARPEVRLTSAATLLSSVEQPQNLGVTPTSFTCLARFLLSQRHAGSC